MKSTFLTADNLSAPSYRSENEMAFKFGIVGLGKIARDQHLPAIAATEGVELVAVASRNAQADGVNNHPDLDAMLVAELALDAVILCQPPAVRFDAAQTALRAGKHVFLEKPPGTTVREVEILAALAREMDVTLFASWHSRFGAAVFAAKQWLQANPPTRLTINWKEDIHVWHPGQDWILEAGGFGVFDPGINALSILTHLFDDPVRVIAASLETPENRGAPIAAKLDMVTAGGVPVVADFDFLQTGPQSWDIIAEATKGTVTLSNGGNALSINGVTQDVGADGEYPAMYRHFVDLIRTGASDVDTAPLQIVADAFMVGQTKQVEAFTF
jgi:D-galactose 1-dehydrogenase